MAKHFHRTRYSPRGLYVVWASFTIAGLAATSACGSGGGVPEDWGEGEQAHKSHPRPVNLSGFGPKDVGNGPTQPPKQSQTNCDAQFSPTISGGDITRLLSVTPKSGCSNAFCKTTTLPGGGTGFTPVSGGNLSTDFPIPKASISKGCPAIPKATVCPTKMSDGKAAAGCEATANDNDCETITLCPDPGGFQDPNDPETKLKVQAPNLRNLTGLTPSYLTQTVPGKVHDALAKLGPLYINPCEWDSVLESATFGFDISGKNGQSAACTTDAECASNKCAKGTSQHIFYGQCANAPSSTAFDYEAGNGVFGAQLRGGLNDGRAQIQRAMFYPTTSFTVSSYATLRATAKIFGVRVNLMSTDLKSKLSECGYDFSWTSSSDGDDFSSLGALILDGLENVGATVETTTGRTRSSTPEEIKTQCERALTAARSAERAVNEQLHEALVASTFYNLTGGGGTIIKTRADAEKYLRFYKNAVDGYKGTLAAFERAQQRALDHTTDAKIFDFQIDLSLPIVKTYGIGPFKVGVEMGVFGRAGVQDVHLKSAANTHFTNTASTPCTGMECMKLQVTTNMMPHVAMGGYAYVGAGFNLGLAGASIKVRGELDLVNVKMPMAGAFGIERTKRDTAAVLSNLPQVRDILQQVKVIAPGARIDPNAVFEVQPTIGQYNAPVMVGGSLSPLEGLALDASFLNGRVELIAEAKLFLVGKKRWRKTIFDWKGQGFTWVLSTPDGLHPLAKQLDLVDPLIEELTAGGKNPLIAYFNMIAAPNIVLLPKVVLSPVPGTMDPASASTAVQTALDTKVMRDGRMYASHHESDLGKTWTTRSGGGRCTFGPEIR